MRAGLAALVVMALVSVARAEPPPVRPAPSPPIPTERRPVEPQPVFVHTAPAPAPAPVQHEPVPAAETAEEGRGVQYGLYAIVPWFFDRSLDLGPGIGAQLRVGWEFPGGAQIELGWQLFWASGVTPDDEPLRLFGHYYTLGFRWAFLNPSALVPMVGVGVALSYWSFSPPNGETGALTLNGLVGFTYELSARVGFEIGVQLDYTLEGKVGWFAETGPQLWMAPFAGITLYY